MNVFDMPGDGSEVFSEESEEAEEAVRAGMQGNQLLPKMKNGIYLPYANDNIWPSAPLRQV